MIMNGNSGSIPNYFAQSYSTSEVALYVNGACVSKSTYNYSYRLYTGCAKATVQRYSWAAFGCNI